MFLGEKELITDSDRTSLLGLRIIAALPVALGCNFAFDVLFFILALILPAVRRWGRGWSTSRTEARAGFGENDGGGVAK